MENKKREEKDDPNIQVLKMSGRITGVFIVAPDLSNYYTYITKEKKGNAASNIIYDMNGRCI